MNNTIGTTILIVALVVMAVVALALGSSGFSLLQVMQGLVFTGDVSGASVSPGDGLAATIVQQIRLPRVLLAILVGAGLAVTGAAIQGLFRNPLADPALIGVSGGAALFAVGFMVFGVQGELAERLGVPGFAFVGGLLTTWLVLEIGRRGAGISSMLLAGIAINAVTISGVGLITYTASDQQLRSVAFWALGSFNGASWDSVWVATVIPLVTFLIFREHRSLNAITLGENEARHLGISVKALQTRIVIYAACAVGVGVALVGVIAFVGLVVPHLVRMTLGSNHVIVLPGSALAGATLVLFADTLSRLVISPAELPVGILTSLVGGPFFVVLILRQKRALSL
jgi:iron complex transport system permease protein